MIQQSRQSFNQSFTEEKYQLYLNQVMRNTGITTPFRLAETPIFIPGTFTKKMTDACSYIIDQIMHPDFNEITKGALPANLKFGGNEGKPNIIVFDFGVCENEQKEWIPMLIEMQGFPSLFGLQILLDDAMRENYRIPENCSSYLNGHTKETYLSFLQNLIIGNCEPNEVILLEWKPEQQKTYIDFVCIKNYLGIETVCLTELKIDGNMLFYQKSGENIPVKRIFNRVIFDDLKKEDLADCISLEKDYDVDWVIHPNWYYRISKYLIPFLQHDFVPEGFFLHELIQPVDLKEYVLKPIFSYGGQGVQMNVTQEFIDTIQNPNEWILQKKVRYANAIETPTGPAKAEIRLFYFWDEANKRYAPMHNLARISKGEMIGTRYNLDATWIGGSIAFFENI